MNILNGSGLLNRASGSRVIRRQVSQYKRWFFCGKDAVTVTQSRRRAFRASFPRQSPRPLSWFLLPLIAIEFERRECRAREILESNSWAVWCGQVIERLPYLFLKIMKSGAFSRERVTSDNRITQVRTLVHLRDLDLRFFLSHGIRSRQHSHRSWN